MGTIKALDGLPRPVSRASPDSDPRGLCSTQAHTPNSTSTCCRPCPPLPCAPKLYSPPGPAASAMSNFAMSKRSQALINLSGPVAAAVVNPLFTAPLLWLLTKAPGQFQEPALRQLARLPASFTVPRIVSALKWLVVFGVVDKLNGWLSSLATNGWSVRSDADRWIWPREVAVVTGGCSGIGEVVVKGLVEKGVKVAILDVQPLPKRLEHSMPPPPPACCRSLLIASRPHLLPALRHHRRRRRLPRSRPDQVNHRQPIHSGQQCRHWRLAYHHRDYTGGAE